MRVLMTGATGLIGKEIGKRLAAGGHEIVVVSRHTEGLALPFPARAFSWAGGDQEFPLSALEGVDVVVNLAGEPIAEGRWNDEKKKRIRDSRVLGTRRLIEAIRQCKLGPRALVQGSAIGYYGDRGDEVLNESSPIGEGFLAEVVRDWESEAMSAKDAGLRVAIVRTSLVLSSRGGALLKLLPLFAKGLGGQLGGGQQWMSWVHIEDIARIFVYCAEYDSAVGVFNASAPEPVRNDRFTLLLARALDRTPFLPVPESALKLALGEAASAVLSSGRVQAQRLAELGFQFKFADLQDAFANLCEPLKGMQHEFVAEQWIPRSPAEIFPYFSSETNLEQITPPFLNFRVVGKSTPEIREGTVLDYKLNLHGVPITWQSRIDEWDPGRKFVDVQTKGPYSKWEHTHEFVPLAGGTLIRDRVLYRLPMGWLGNAFGAWKVESDVEEIFNFRRKRIDEMFGRPAELGRPS